jgi:hypothetical protein
VANRARTSAGAAQYPWRPTRRDGPGWPAVLAEGVR